MRYLFFLILVISVLSCEDKKDLQVIYYLRSPAANNSAQPFLFSSGKDLYMSWMHKKNDSLVSLQYSKLNDSIWDAPSEIASGSNWFVNWADFPAIAVNDGNILSHFLQKSAEGTYTYDIRLKLFNKKTNSWKEDFVLHNDSTQAEHGFVTMLPYQNDAFFVTWLDGRNTTENEGHQGPGAMTIRAATISSGGKVTNEVELDYKTCDCCQTSAALTENGPIVVYRDRSDNEIRDISISRFLDGNWTSPEAVFHDNWKIEGCPVNGPKAASHKNYLAIAWYTAAKELPKVNLIFSKDNGMTFDAPILIDEIRTIGRVDVAFINANHVLVSWVTSENSQTVLKAMKVDLMGERSDPFVVAKFDPSRSSGFPQLEILNDRAYFAWTDVIGENPSIKTAFVQLDNL